MSRRAKRKSPSIQVLHEAKRMIHELRKNFYSIWLGVILGVFASQIVAWNSCTQPPWWLAWIPPTLCQLYSGLFIVILTLLEAVIVPFLLIVAFIVTASLLHKLGF